MSHLFRKLCVYDLVEDSTTVCMSRLVTYVKRPRQHNEREITLKKQHRNPSVLSDRRATEPAKEELDSSWSRLIRRRKFLQGLGAAGVAGAALPATTLFAKNDKKLSKDDVKLLQLALTIELIEADLWQQYNELGGAVDKNDQPNPGNPAYIAALQNLDGDMPQYISDHTDDEISHE